MLPICRSEVSYEQVYNKTLALSYIKVEKFDNDFHIKDDDAYQNIGTATTDCKSLGLFKDDLNMIFKIIKIVAPILVIVFSVYDFIKAAAGKVEGEMKKAFSKLLKRMIFAIILFFLPTVLNYFLGLAIPGFEGCITG